MSTAAAYDVKAAAARLGVSSGVVYRLVKKAHIKATRLPGRRSHLRLDPADVERLKELLEHGR